MGRHLTLACARSSAHALRPPHVRSRPSAFALKTGSVAHPFQPPAPLCSPLPPVLMWQACTGKLPWVSEPQEGGPPVLRPNPKFPSMPHSWPDPLRSLVLRCLLKNPKARPRMTQVVSELRALILDLAPEFLPAEHMQHPQEVQEVEELEEARGTASSSDPANILASSGPTAQLVLKHTLSSTTSTTTSSAACNTMEGPNATARVGAAAAVLAAEEEVKASAPQASQVVSTYMFRELLQSFADSGAVMYDNTLADTEEPEPRSSWGQIEGPTSTTRPMLTVHVGADSDQSR